jgi:microcystin-dependent protein
MCIKCKVKSCKGSCQNSGNNSKGGNGNNSFGGNGFGSNGSSGFGGNGTNGANGFGGVNGNNGGAGGNGVNGANGAGGANGGAGGTGLRGPRGFQGPAGPPGPAGVGSGTPGAQGQQGNPGQQGQQGNPGQNGAPGQTGPAPTITIGVVTQGPTPAVAVTGTNPYALNFTLPKGDQGTPGSAGAPGLLGIQGNMGANSVLFKKGDGAVAGTVGVSGAATYTAVTQIAISHTTINGYGGAVGAINGGLQWAQGIVKNSIIQLVDAQNSANFGIYKVDGLGVSGNTHIYVVTLVHANGSIPAANTEISASYNIPGQDAIPNNTGGNSTAQGAGAGLFPVGGIIPWAGAVGVTVPVGWLLCDGQIVSTVTYGDLFSVIGTEYNLNPVPPNTFSVPNLIDKIPYGGTAANTGTEVGDNASVGTVVGTATIATLAGNASVTVTGTASVTIGIGNLPEHTHSLTGVSIGGGAHGHTILADQDGGSGGSKGIQLTQDPTSPYDCQPNGNGWISGGDHTHTFSGTIDNAGTGGTTTASGTMSGTGSGPITGTGAGTITGTASGDNRQKSITMRYIIKY